MWGVLSNNPQKQHGGKKASSWFRRANPMVVDKKLVATICHNASRLVQFGRTGKHNFRIHRIIVPHNNFNNWVSTSEKEHKLVGVWIGRTEHKNLTHRFTISTSEQYFMYLYL